MKCFLWALALICWQTGIYAQSTVVEGRLRSSQQRPASDVSVRLLNEANQILAYTFSTPEGYYRLETATTGKATLMLSSISYEGIRIPVQLQGQRIVIDTVLQESSVALEEVIVVADQPIEVKKDTIVFDAEAFKQGNEQVVEDLLKKLPGVTVEQDGTIKVRGQEVDKVMIEGDDFFEGGYKLLTKNMPAQPIAQVELLQRYSSNRLLKGVEQSDKIALNLRLSEDAKQQWFANAKLGLGASNQPRYFAQANIFSVGRKNKYYFLLGGNNIGYDATGEMRSYGRSMDADAKQEIGDDMGLSALIQLQEERPNLPPERTAFSNEGLASANAIFNPNEQWKAKLSVQGIGGRHFFYRNTRQTFSKNAGGFSNTEDNTFFNGNLAGSGKIELLWDGKKRSNFQSTTRYELGNMNASNQLVFNSIDTEEALASNRQRFDQLAVFTVKNKRDRVWVLSARYLIENQPQTYTISRFFYQGLFDESKANRVEQVSNRGMQFAGFDAHSLKRNLGKHLLEMKAGGQWRSDQWLGTFALLDAAYAQYPQAFQNDANYGQGMLYAHGTYRWKYSDRLQMGAQLRLQQWALSYMGKHSQPFFANPSVGIDWQPSGTQALSLSYQYQTRNATLPELYGNYMLSGFRQFQRGWGDWALLRSSVALLNYRAGGYTDNVLFNAFVFYRKSHDFFTASSEIAPNYALQSQILGKGQSLLSASGSVDVYINPISSNLKGLLSLSNTGYENTVNGKARQVAISNTATGFELRSTFKGFFNYHIGGKWAFNHVAVQNAKQRFLSQEAFIDFLLSLGKHAFLQLHGERYAFSGEALQAKAYYFADFRLQYAPNPNKYTLSLAGKNLLNTRNYQTLLIDDVSAFTTNYRLMPWYVMLQVGWRL